MAGIKVKSLEVQIRTITLKFVTVGKVIYWFIAIAIDLFRLSILFSQYRSYDDTPESFFFFSKLGRNFHAHKQSFWWTWQRFKPPRYRQMICIGKKNWHDRYSINRRCYEYVRLENIPIWNGINISSLLKYLDIAPLKLFRSNESIVAIM